MLLCHLSPHKLCESVHLVISPCSSHPLQWCLAPVSVSRHSLTESAKEETDVTLKKRQGVYFKKKAHKPEIAL